MIKYTISIGSFFPHSVEIVSEILHCPSLSQILFPATLPTSLETDVRFVSPHEFDLSVIPRAFYVDDVLGFSLRGDNGIEVGVTLYLEKQLVAPNIINLEFTDQHLSQSVITYQNLKSLFEEVAPIFKMDIANLYDDANARRRDGKWIETTNNRDYELRIDWFSYFGADLVELIGQERFTQLTCCAEIYKLHGGMMVILQTEPFDDTNPEHRERQALAEAKLGLDELAKMS